MTSSQDNSFSISHLMQTPTLAFTSSGILCLVLWFFKVPFADLAAFIFFVLAGAGTAMALGSEVRRKQQTWGWMGLFKAIRDKPSKFFVTGFFGHLPQLLAAFAIALIWRRKSRRR